MSVRFTVANGRALSANLSVTDSYGEGMVFVSAFGYTSNVDQAKADVKKKVQVSVGGHYYRTDSDAYDVFTSKVANTEYSHIIITKKDKAYKDEYQRDMISFFAFIDDLEVNQLEVADLSSMRTAFPQKLVDIVYDKLYKMSPAPILKDWIPFIIRSCANTGRFRELEDRYVQDTDKHQLSAYVMRTDVNYIIDQISSGLRSGAIAINGATRTSYDMQHMSGIDAYLNTFSDILAQRIQGAFVPRFTPGQDAYSKVLDDLADYAEYHGHLKLYDAQKSVIQATSNALDHKKAAFIIGECGSGKTAMGIGTVMTNMNDWFGKNVIIMCPAHLVRKWKAEIERLAPRSEAVIVDDFSSLLKLEPKIKDKKRKKNLWLIFSKETAKFGYEERPAAVLSTSKFSHWGARNSAYVCPCCGKPLTYTTYEGRGRYRQEVVHHLTDRDFLKKTANNIVCKNVVHKWNPDKMLYEDVPCGTKLWQAFSKDVDYGNGNAADEWVKTKLGWVQAERIQPMLDEFVGKMDVGDTLSKEDSALMEALMEVADEEARKSGIRAPRKYPIAKYIHKHMKGCIDYLVADEIHQLKGSDTAQGEALGDIASIAKHTLVLTGTLLNGYASGIYYILYRLFAGEMKKEGYEYDAPDVFAKEYGVVKTESSFEWDSGSQGRRHGASKTKYLPGVSPLVFTKFLLENAAFISQEDIASGLPGYQEIPVAVKMDEELASAYEMLEDDVRRNSNIYRGGMRIMAQMVQSLTVYPDQPFDQPPIVDPKDGSIVAQPMDLDSSRHYAKELKLLELCQEKVNAGEKVLVYYHWTNRTNIGRRLKGLLEEHGIKTTVMGSNIKAKDRDAWIKERLAGGTQVLICNPSLVETGLDLLDFTTIIFFQMGYNLFTMRQASRRSWRLSQEHDIEVYFMYYKDTVQERAISLMATKLQASMAIEGKFSEEGLNAMSNNEDILTQIASSVTEGIKDTMDTAVFEKTSIASTKEQAVNLSEATLAEKLGMPSYYSARELYRNGKMRSKRLLYVDGITTAIQENPMLLLQLA